MNRWGRIVRLKPDLLDAERARVSLTMIVRDEQENLPRALESVRGLFDEIVIVDTGSRDRTVEIAREFGARVFHFAWVDDFAAARNAALAHATGDYAFWLDADDVVEPAERRKLESARCGQCGAAAGNEATRLCRAVRAVIPDRAEAAAILLSIISGCFPCSRACAGRTRSTSRSCRPCAGRGVPVQWTDITVRHTGYSDRALRTKKLERDTRILLGELGERPNDPFVLV